jgi:hypothetical protein
MNTALLAGRGHALDLLLKRLETPVSRLLAEWELTHIEEPDGDHLHRREPEGPIDHPVMVSVRILLGFFERIAPQIEKQRQTQVNNGLAPHLQLVCAVRHQIHLHSECGKTGLQIGNGVMLILPSENANHSCP